MRLTVIALTILPFAAHAQTATAPTVNEPVAQTQSCPVGMGWSAAAGACVATEDSTPAITGLGGHGCNYGAAAREVTS